MIPTSGCCVRGRPAAAEKVPDGRPRVISRRSTATIGAHPSGSCARPRFVPNTPGHRPGPRGSLHAGHPRALGYTKVREKSLRLGALLAPSDVERHGPALLELTKARGVDRGVVGEDVRAAAVLGEPKPFAASNHFTAPVAMLMTISRRTPPTTRKAAVIALAPAARHSKMPMPKGMGLSNHDSWPGQHTPRTFCHQKGRAVTLLPPAGRGVPVGGQAHAAAAQAVGGEVAEPAARRYSALIFCASSSWSSRTMIRQAASIGVPWSTSSRARAAMRSW